MFKRIRQLHISLAAKCQLLFGAAVVLIIGAALFVPWQRMEQLTEQLNERSARTLIEYAIDAHVGKAAEAVAQAGSDVTQAAEAADAALPDASVTTRPAPLADAARVSPASTQPVGDAQPSFPPRLILTAPGRDDSALTPFERRAVRRLAERRDR